MGAGLVRLSEFGGPRRDPGPAFRASPAAPHSGLFAPPVGAEISPVRIKFDT